MDASGGDIGWRHLREFVDVDVSRSFVIGWHVERAMLVIDVDLYLEPDHPFYETPRPAEKVCVRPAVIEFPYCDELVSDRVTGANVLEIAGNLGHGAIEDLRVVADGRYEISGEFGTVSVNAERPILKLKGP